MRIHNFMYLEKYTNTISGSATPISQRTAKELSPPSHLVEILPADDSKARLVNCPREGRLWGTKILWRHLGMQPSFTKGLIYFRFGILVKIKLILRRVAKSRSSHHLTQRNDSITPYKYNQSMVSERDTWGFCGWLRKSLLAPRNETMVETSDCSLQFKYCC